MRPLRVVVYGAHGFVGAAIVAAFRDMGTEPEERVRGDGLHRGTASVVVNAACPSRRFVAESDPDWDYRETVIKTTDILGTRWRRFLQVSSLSARNWDTAYARHRWLADEAVLARGGTAVRLGPMYGAGLTKGYLLDMAAGRPVYARRETRYGYMPVEWAGARLASMAVGKPVGIVELAGKGFVTLGEIADGIGSPSRFLPGDAFDAEDQYLAAAPKFYPDARRVIDWLRAR
jgi:nucleoside-diphosphate-sugar epimerase